MAMNLLRAGFHLRVWNRTHSRASDLAAAGATAAATPADATRGADIVITMLADGQAVSATMAGPEGGLYGAARGQTWVQMSTVGVQWTRRFARDAAALGVTYVDAPACGSEGPARAAGLVILASGPDDARDELAPVFEALGRSTVWLGEAGAGTAAKLVLNHLLVNQAEAAAEALTFAASLDLDPAAVLDVLSQTPLASPYAMQKARAMLAGDFRPAFALKHAIKGADLAVDAARESGARLKLTEALLPGWRRAASNGHADDDLAAVYSAQEEPVRAA
jgi:3-hydroxyisobutyrate dehydrogenase